MKSKWLLFGVFAGGAFLCLCAECLVIAVLLGAPSTASRANLPTVKTYARGDAVRAGNWEYTVTKVERTRQLVWSDFGNRSDAQGIFVVIYLTLKNLGKQNYSINSWDFELRDDNDAKYQTARDMLMIVRQMKLASLGDQFVPGLSIQTALIFDVNPDATGLKLYLDQARAAIDLSE